MFCVCGRVVISCLRYEVVDQPGPKSCTLSRYLLQALRMAAAGIAQEHQ